MSLAPSTSPITAQPLPGGVNPFDGFPREMVEAILDRVDTRLAAEYACKLFSSFTDEFLEKGEEPQQFHLRPIRNEEFYPLFKKRMRQLHVEFPSDAFMNGIIKYNEFFIDHTTITQDSREAWNQLYNSDTCLIVTLYDLVFEDLTESYTKQDIEKITPKNFTKIMLFLPQHYRETTPLDIEIHLRRRIKKHGTEQHAQRAAEIEKIRSEFADLSPDAPRFLQAQRPLIAELEQEKEKLEKKRLELCGPHGCDGTIEAARKAKEKAKAEFAAQLRLAGELPMATSIASDKYVFRFVSRILARESHCPSGLLDAENNYQDSWKQHSLLVAQRKEIEQFDGSGQIIGGRLFEIERELQPDVIAARVRPRMNLLAQFYDELNRNAEGRDEGERSRALTRILAKW